MIITRNIQRAYGIASVVGTEGRHEAHQRAARLGPYSFAQTLEIGTSPDTQIVSEIPAKQTQVNAA